VSYVFSSELRIKVLSVLSKSKFTPTQLAEMSNSPISHVSKALGELQSRGLIVCLTPSRKKGRFYTITELGGQILDEINRITRRIS